ncbi:hypothetical protein J7T14_10780 [Citrobacter freundii]|uniref:hypothetical protein n=1 Tax=Citrobacter freundii TaxID=546 RepID=UPI001B3618BB|nr:hypothetical protein [Citrobacter freundii]MBQ0345908.1 hypothetical protein [Citrobacter freundii]
MIFGARYLVELPYVLNIPDGEYEFLYENDHLRLTIHNNYYALFKDANLFPQTLAIGTRDQLLPHNTNDRGMMKCRTVISLGSVFECFNLSEISEEELINTIRSQIRRGEEFPSKEEAKKHLSTMSQQEIDNKINSERIIKTAREIFPPTQSQECIGIINHFIRHYRVAFNDQFADEISLYQAGSGFTNGVLQEHYCNGVKVSAIPLVGIITPLMRQSWFNHDDTLIEKFKCRLMTEGFSDQPELLLVRANNFVHKGALRSAVIEASAGLESYILRLLIDAFHNEGYDERQVKEALNKDWKFEDRCKKLFKKFFNISVPEIAQLEWQIANKYRKELRDKIAHTSHEPTETETKEFINSISSLISKINEFFKEDIQSNESTIS